MYLLQFFLARFAHFVASSALREIFDIHLTLV